MKLIKKSFIIQTILLLLFVTLFTNKKENIQASTDGVEAVIDSKGNVLKYRNSTETVYKLKEFNYPTNQLRAVWVSAFVGDVKSYSTKEAYIKDHKDMLDRVESMGMNAIVYHVRTHNNAFYKSKLNPLARWMKGVNFDEFDPIQWLITECHSRGIEFHAWLNPYRVATDGKIQSNSVTEIPSGNPALDDNNLIKVGNNIILDPGIPKVRDFIVDTCMEIVENYDVDAIHFDDYFYISGADDTKTRQIYNTENLSVGDFRRKQVDLFIEALSNQIRNHNKKTGRCVQLGISPSNVYRNGSYTKEPTYSSDGTLISPVYSNTSGFAHYDNYLYSDTLNWVNHEWIDYIMPQCYHATEHMAVSYAECVKWWSWAVRYKKVNLYTGMGIYMAIGSGSSAEYWNLNKDEIERQLLIAGAHEEFSGACFYKYGSMKSTSNEVIRNAVDVISNKFWKVRIPSAINKYYAPIIDEVAPTIVTYKQSTNELTWPIVNDVRGYMVYKVKKGSTLNKNNINHVLSYIQTNTIKISEIDKYDYYVASVNFANEISDATMLLNSLTSSDVIELINNINQNITQNEIEQIKYARKMYDLLTTVEQEKVTNINKLVELEEKVNKLNDLSNQLDTYINTLEKHITTNKKLPTKENITITHKYSENQALYNIDTGERLKNYLATKEIPLIATITKENLTYQKEFMINIGITSTNQIGLFYRNDPSSVGVDDEGKYVEGGNGFIGWSGHSVVVGKYILFIARSNYKEITDINNIEKCSWVSVAAAYVNKTNAPLTMTMGQAFESKSTVNDGYFIISDNKVKEVSPGFDASKVINLDIGEAVIIVRYLDSTIDGSPLAPVTKIEIGTKAYIDQEKEKTLIEIANEVINLINSIKENISLEDKQYIYMVKEKYDALTEEQKTYVTNIDKLENSLNKINQLEKAFNEYKKTSITNISTYLDKTLYSQTKQLQITRVVNDAITKINNAKTTSEIDKIVTDTKYTLDTIETLNDELNAYKKEQIEKLNKIDKTKYSTSNITKISNYINSGINAINSSTTIDLVTKAYNEAINKINSVLTIEQEAAQLKAYKEEYINKVDDYIESYKDKVTADEMKELLKNGEKFKIQINNATSLSDINYIYTRAVATIDLYKDNLRIARQKAIEELNLYVENSHYIDTEAAILSTKVEELINTINSTCVIEDIKKLADEFIENDRIRHTDLQSAKDSSTKTFDDIIKAWYTKGQISYINKLILKYQDLIQSSYTNTEVFETENAFKELVNTYITDMDLSISTLRAKLANITSASKEVTSLINSTKQSILVKETKEQIEELSKEFDEKYALLNRISEIEAELLEYVALLNIDEYEKEVVNDIVTKGLNNILKSTTIDDIDTQFIKVKDEIKNYQEQIKIAKENAKNKLLAINTTKAKIKDLVSKTLNKIEKQSSVDEINKIMNEFDKSYVELSSTSCKKANMVIYISFTMAVGIICILLKKKD